MFYNCQEIKFPSDHRHTIMPGAKKLKKSLFMPKIETLLKPDPKIIKKKSG